MDDIENSKNVFNKIDLLYKFGRKKTISLDRNSRKFHFTDRNKLYTKSIDIYRKRLE